MKESNNNDLNIKEHLDRLEIDFDQNAEWDKLQVKLPKKKKNRWLFFFIGIASLASFSIFFLFRPNILDVGLEQTKGNLQKEERESFEAESTIRQNIVNSEEKGIVEPAAKSNFEKDHEVADLSTLSSAISQKRSLSNPIKTQQGTNVDRAIGFHETASQSTSKLLTEEIPDQASTREFEYLNPLGFLSRTLPDYWPTSLFLTPRVVDLDVQPDEEKKSQFMRRMYFGLETKYMLPILKNIDPSLTSISWNESNLPLSSFGGAAMVGVNIDEHWSIATGLLYERMYFELDWNHTELIREKVFKEEAFFEEKNGQIEWLADSVYVQRINTKRRQRLQQYQKYSIPLRLQYSRNGNRLGFGIEGGLDINIRSQFNGYLLNQAQNEIVFYDWNDDNGAFKKNTGISLQIAPSLNYKLGKHISIMAKFGLQYQISNIYEERYFAGARMHAMNTSLGLRYTFGGD